MRTTTKAGAAMLASGLLLGAGLTASAGTPQSGTASDVLPLVPCRLLDSRASETPIVGGQTTTIDLSEIVGDCEIPADATGLSVSVVAIRPTSNAFLTLFPSDQDRPAASQMNVSADDRVTSSGFDVTLSPDGEFDVYASAGSLDVVIDVLAAFVPAAAGGTGGEGPAGADGAQGPAGVDGAQGPAGPVGEPGIDGVDGAEGPTGATGATGEPGVDGVQGPAGVDGEPGIDGVDGEDGIDGIDGVDGEPGVDGVDGATGATGPTGVGLQGDTGAQGPAGPGADLLGTNTSRARNGRNGECVLGEVWLTAGSTGSGIAADGELLSISQNEALFSLLGVTYGGDGRATFALPDLRAAAPNGLTYQICTVGTYPSPL